MDIALAGFTLCMPMRVNLILHAFPPARMGATACQPALEPHRLTFALKPAAERRLDPVHHEVVLNPLISGFL